MHRHPGAYAWDLAQAWSRRRIASAQWEWGRPVPHIPQEVGLPVQVGPSDAFPVEEANTDNLLESFGDPQ